MSEEALTMPLLGAGSSEPAGENVPDSTGTTGTDTTGQHVDAAAPEVPVKRVPTVYFIDDSATMREVIKIAFRRENINVITCADAASALAQFEQNRPDVVITDVIMPDQDGYSVCSQIKQNPELAGIPVVLMSGVVNKSVADKAVAVKADELIRKPFQPQELIGRVKNVAGSEARAVCHVARAEWLGRAAKFVRATRAGCRGRRAATTGCGGTASGSANGTSMAARARGSIYAIATALCFERGPATR